MAARKPQLRSGREKGTVIAEMALALPLLLLIVAGVLDLGFLFWEKEVLTNAAREGARAGARATTDATIDSRGDNVPEKKVSQVKTLVQTYLTNYKIKNASGNPITLDGSNFNYTWDTSTTPATLKVELINIPVKLMMLPNMQKLFTSGTVDLTVNLNAETTMAAEWDKTKPPLN